jgi:hypothetical protein
MRGLAGDFIDASAQSNPRLPAPPTSGWLLCHARRADAAAGIRVRGTAVYLDEIDIAAT